MKSKEKDKTYSSDKIYTDPFKKKIPVSVSMSMTECIKIRDQAIKMKMNLSEYMLYKALEK